MLRSILRLTSTITGKRIYASRSLLCIFASSSNRRSNAGGKMLTEERGDAKLHRLSPQLHRPPLLPCARAAAAPMRARRRCFAHLLRRRRLLRRASPAPLRRPPPSIGHRRRRRWGKKSWFTIFEILIQHFRNTGSTFFDCWIYISKMLVQHFRKIDSTFF